MAASKKIKRFRAPGQTPNIGSTLPRTLFPLSVRSFCQGRCRNLLNNRLEASSVVAAVTWAKTKIIPNCCSTATVSGPQDFWSVGAMSQVYRTDWVRVSSVHGSCLALLAVIDFFPNFGHNFVSLGGGQTFRGILESPWASQNFPKLTSSPATAQEPL